MNLARVFPRRTTATPDDDLVFTCEPPLIRPDIDEVHVSATFTYDLPMAERLAASWSRFYPTRLGGPATGARGEDFVPGRYLKPGYVITSRGCPNKCWFCSVWQREGREVRELPVIDGWNVLDDNLLACSREHFATVCEMLKRQPKRAEFTGGLEAARLTAWHVNLLVDLKPFQFFFAYDEEDDWEPLVEASRLLPDSLKFPQVNAARCYVLIGYPKDTIAEAEQRLNACCRLGLLPMAMLWRPESGEYDRLWRVFQRPWARMPAIVQQAREALSG